MSGTTTTVTTPTPTIAMIASEWGAVIVSVVALMIFLAAIVVAWKTQNPSLQILLGIAGSNATTAVGFWLGSSFSSQKKDNTIASITGSPNPMAVSTTRVTTSN